jgi:hypothetical protein
MQVRMCEITAQVPPEVLRSVQAQVEDMARALAQIDRGSPVWDSLRDSGVSVEVLGWKFKFNVEPEALVLAEAEPVPPQIA